MSENSKYIIIGNGISGIIAAETIRKNDPDSSIKIFTDEKHPFYARMRLPEYLASELPYEKLILKDNKWYEELKIELFVNAVVLDIDTENKTVTMKNGSKHSYDKLLLATGSHSNRPPIPGLETEEVFTLRNLDDADKISSFVEGKSKAVIIGGGLLGLEAGKALTSHGLKITIIEYSKQLLPRQLDAAGANMLQYELEKLGYSFVLGEPTNRVYRDEGQLTVLLGGGRKISGDLILVAAGVRPNLMLAKKAGIKTDKAIVVNDFMQTSNPDIFAAGDCIEHNGRCYGVWSAAKEQGLIAGSNMVRLIERYSGTTMKNVLKVAGINLVSIGDTEATNKSCIVITDDEKCIYKKYIMDGDILVGCILLGDISEQKMLETAIKSKSRFTHDGSVAK